MRGAITQAAVEEMGGFGTTTASNGAADEDDDDYDFEESDDEDSDAGGGTKTSRGGKRATRAKPKNRAKRRGKGRGRGQASTSGALPAHHGLALGSRPGIPLGAALDRAGQLRPVLDAVEKAPRALGAFAEAYLDRAPSAMPPRLPFANRCD